MALTISATSNGFRVERVRKSAHIPDGIIDRHLERLLVLGSVRTCIVAMRFELFLMQQRSKGGPLWRRRGGAATSYGEKEGERDPVAT